MEYDDLIAALNENTRELKNLQKLLPYHVREISKTETLLRVKEEKDKMREAVLISADLIFDMTEDEW
jgi:hypothetical protein